MEVIVAKQLPVYIFNSLIQISSSSKGGTFLWITSFFFYESIAWRLFNPVGKGLVCGWQVVNNFQFFHQPVDKCKVIRKLSPDFSRASQGVIHENRYMLFQAKNFHIPKK